MWHAVVWDARVAIRGFWQKIYTPYADADTNNEDRLEDRKHQLRAPIDGGNNCSTLVHCWYIAKSVRYHK